MSWRDSSNQLTPVNQGINMRNTAFTLLVMAISLLLCSGVSGQDCATTSYAGPKADYWHLPQGETTMFAMRFTPVSQDTLKTVSICVWDPGDGSYGDDSLSVVIYADDGFGLPGAGLATKKVPPGSYVKYPDTTEVDFSAFNLVFDSDFHVGVEIISTINYESILSDSGTAGTARSSYQYQGAWYAFPGGGDEDYNFLIEVYSCHSAKGSSCETPPRNLVLWLPFDEASGPKAMNALGGNNGKCYNNPSFVSGKVSNAICFSGGTSYVEVKSYDAINFGSGDFSFDAWVKRSPGDNGTRVIIDKRMKNGSNYYGYSVFLLDGQLYLQLATGSYFNLTSTPPLTVPSDGDWHFVAVTVRRNPALIMFYVDDNSGWNMHSQAGSVTSTEPLRVGMRSLSSGGGGSFLGCIDELELYRRELKGYEVQKIHDIGKDGKCKVFCEAPCRAPICVNFLSITVDARICNSTFQDRWFDYKFEWNNKKCPSILGDTPLLPQILPLVFVPAGQCAPIPLNIVKPTLLAAGVWARYEMTTTDISTGDVFNRFGSVIGVDKNCPEIANPVMDFFNMPVDSVVSIGPISLTNTGVTSSTVDYAVTCGYGEPHRGDSSVVWLNGLPPGTPVTGTVILGPGESTDLPLTAEFVEYDPLTPYTVFFKMDIGDVDSLVAVASISLHNYIPSTETYVGGDANGDGSVDISDAVYLIAYIFSGGSAPEEGGDANCDGGVDISDAVYLIAYIFSGGAAPVQCTSK
jgi:hypothetical protein